MDEIEEPSNYPRCSSREINSSLEMSSTDPDLVSSIRKDTSSSLTSCSGCPNSRISREINSPRSATDSLFASSQIFSTLIRVSFSERIRVFKIKFGAGGAIFLVYEFLVFDSMWNPVGVRELFPILPSVRYHASQCYARHGATLGSGEELLCSSNS